MRAPSLSLRARLDKKAHDLGFDLCRVTIPDALGDEAGQRLQAWLAAGYAGDMGWMAQTFERRSQPKNLWPQARTIIMLGVNYGPEGDALAGLRQPETGNISVYARARDYHDVIKGRLKMLGQWLVAQAQAEQAPGGMEIKVFIDTAPVMEKPLAAAAGLGWQGRHTNLVSREMGSWLFLGSIFTTLTLAADAPETDHCGTCHACLDVCPTGAFPAPYQLDARRCISYLTIEHPGHIAEEFRASIGNRIYGCDDCLAVCPWNKFAQRGREAKLSAPPDWQAPSLRALLALDDAGFRHQFAGSPVKRIGHTRFLRNVLIAAGNSGQPDLCAPVSKHLRHASPLVRKMAVWALRQLASLPYCYAMAAQYLPYENDAEVVAEWKALGDDRV
ncbi:MAG: tRNA epoxyqueuosine(34) reductase QueG [Hyphomicrobiales bacterium]|nr:tRNA epoxyqueuosine(34) reductase QueG [Hyphomicrobiales bacterium]MDE2115757.1 tRNA epoxyqueuosine(34) reductase QueG [Hyphomicrobiales bacterium]